MDDRWLKSTQKPLEVERLLAAFATGSGLVPAGAYRLRDQRELPDTLLAVAARVAGHVWVCFSQGSNYWFFAGVVSRALSRLRKEPVLLINSYREDGVPVELGAWAVQADETWQRVK